MSIKQSNNLWMNLIVTARPSHQQRQGMRQIKKKEYKSEFSLNGALTKTGQHLIFNRI